MQNKFLLTNFIMLIGAVGCIVAIIAYFEPNYYFAALLLLLIGFVANMLFALIYYFLTPIKGFETSRDVFRRGYKRGIIFGAIVILALTAQYFFNLI